MAAPVRIKDANWHRSKQLLKECGWKRGDSALVNLREEQKNGASRWSAIRYFADTTN
jgi:hypothetical protein